MCVLSELMHKENRRRAWDTLTSGEYAHYLSIGKRPGINEREKGVKGFDSQRKKQPCGQSLAAVFQVKTK